MLLVNCASGRGGGKGTVSLGELGSAMRERRKFVERRKKRGTLYRVCRKRKTSLCFTVTMKKKTVQIQGGGGGKKKKRETYLKWGKKRGRCSRNTGKSSELRFAITGGEKDKKKKKKRT